MSFSQSRKKTHILCVPVSHVPDELPRGGEVHVAELALVRLGAGVSVDVVLQRGQGLEAALAHRALVRALLEIETQMNSHAFLAFC